MKLSLVIISSIVAVASASTIAVTTASIMKDIMDDMTTLGNDFEKINDLLNVFPQNGVKAAAVIHDRLVENQAHFTKTAASINALPKPVSTVNGKLIVEAYESILPSFPQPFLQIASKVADFTALGEAPFNTMKEDLSETLVVCLNFRTGLSSITPTAMVSSLDLLRAPASAALTEAIAAFL